MHIAQPWWGTHHNHILSWRCQRILTPHWHHLQRLQLQPQACFFIPVTTLTWSVRRTKSTSQAEMLARAQNQPTTLTITPTRRQRQPRWTHYPAFSSLSGPATSIAACLSRSQDTNIFITDGTPLKWSSTDWSSIIVLVWWKSRNAPTLRKPIFSPCRKQSMNFMTFVRMP